jgi:hypothetical protein
VHKFAAIDRFRAGSSWRRIGGGGGLVRRLAKAEDGLQKAQHNNAAPATAVMA